MSEAAAVIAAAGRGTRFGGPIPKVFLPLGGRPMLEWSLQAYSACEHVAAIVLVVPPELLDRAARIAEDEPKDVDIVPGGEARPASVRAGLEALRE
ncbi:MAG: IspD/TarI family cytidylyltransferase, partial [Armatimonadota bacterium]